ncbi:MAG: four helix bundle protein [Clostridia bacterium]|nr:four helix bundle protein [Clostridia bacterium]
MDDNKDKLREDTICFAIDVSDVCDGISDCKAYVWQLERSSSSIGANIHEARYAQSRADFINKFEVALKECYETEYWLELLHRKKKLDDDTYLRLTRKCGSIRRIIISSVTTAKRNAGQTPG